MIVINLFAGAGAGKSTMAAEVFSRLKKLGLKTELVGEYAKECVYQKAYQIMSDQLWLFANQAHRLRSLDSYGVTVAVCDSPLLLSMAYQRGEDKSFNEMVIAEHNRYKNLNYLLSRNDDFWKADGRCGDLNNAHEIDSLVAGILKHQFHKSLKPGNIEQVIKDVQKVCTEV